MKNLHLPWIGKSIGCIALAGCLLCGSTVPAYAATPAYDTVALARTVRPAGHGEYLYTQLNDNEKAIYDAIVDQIEKLATDSAGATGIEVAVPKDTTPSERPIFAVFRDHPEFFWVNSDKLSWGQTGSNENGNDIYALECTLGEQSFFYEGFTTEILQQYRDDLDAKVTETKADMPATAQDTLSQLKYLNDGLHYIMYIMRMVSDRPTFPAARPAVF